jgi:hypothetical protein
MSKLKQLFTLAIVVSFLAGCTQVSRKLGDLTDNKYAKPRSGTVWVVPPPDLEPPSSANKTVYVSYRNISDADIEILDLLKTSAQDQGWRIVSDPNKAKYRLRATTRFFGEVEPDSGGAFVGRSLGLITGAAVGIGTGAAIASSSGSNFAGAAAGGLVGGLVAAGMVNGSGPREWALIIDVVLEEYSSKPVEFEMSTDSSSGRSDSSGTGNSRTASGGGTNSGNSRNASMTKKSNYFPHGIRLSVWSNQMNMQEEEAMPEIMSRTKRVVTRMLPM